MTLALEDVELTYGSFEFGPVDVTFDPGVTAVIGPSGSGKSTLLHLIAGFERPDAGTIALGGRRIDALPPEERNVGMVFQNYALFPHLTVRENLEFGATPETDLEATATMLEIEGLLSRSPETLSGGEKQRVALARALVSDPGALLLDEPLASLDAPIRRRLRLDLRDVLADLDVPVVYVTHDQEEAAVVGDRVAIVHQGDIVQAGGLSALFEEPASAFVADFLGMENIFYGTVIETDGTRTTVDLGGVTVTGTGLANDAEVAVAVHPDAIELRRGSAERGPNAIPCTIRRVVEQHGGGTAVLDCERVGQLTASLSQTAGETLEAGVRRIATFDPADARVTSP
ncbi:MAG: ABC transporter ATP-binding protein [Halanaeroarchaeum sp.]